MARIRNIKPEFFLNEELADLAADTRLAFIGLWTLADWTGRLEDRPRRMLPVLFPYHPKTDLERILSDLASRGFIRRYKVDGGSYIEIPKFQKHQCISKKEREKPSTIPPPDKNGSGTEPEPTQKSDTNIDTDEGHVTETDSAEPVPASTPDEILITIECVGEEKKFHFTKKMADEYAQLYPTIDVIAETKKAKAWLISNPTNRKTSKGMTRFLNGWFSRAVNSGHGRSYVNVKKQLAPGEKVEGVYDGDSTISF